MLKKHRNRCDISVATLTHHSSLRIRNPNPLECTQDHSARDLGVLILKVI